MMLANTLEQAAKLEDDPEVAARVAGSILYQKGILSEPPSNLKELLDMAEVDGLTLEWLSGMSDYPLLETDRGSEPDPTLWDLAVMA